MLLYLLLASLRGALPVTGAPRKSGEETPGQLRLGDRGDGTAAGKLAARQRYAHINAGHVPDIIRHGARPPTATE